MKKILMLMMGIFLMASMFQFVSSEIYLWNNDVVSTAENTTTHHAFYKLDDTSDGFRLRNKGVDVDISYHTQNLPYNLTYGQVDWCNLTIIHYANDYNDDGNLINYTTEIQSYYFTTGLNSGDIIVNLKDADELSSDMKCHYTDARSLYQDNVLAGSFSTYVGSYECKGCEQYTLEELSGEIERSEETTESELKIYDIIGTILGLNYRLWLIASWIIKLGLLLVAIGLVFSGVYYLYKFLMDIGRRI